MKSSAKISRITGWLLGLTIATLGILNLILVHPVPGLIYILLSMPFFPPLREIFQQKTQIKIPFVLLFILALVIFWFTLGISDLGEMYGF